MWWQISCCSRHASAESRAEGLEEELKAACDDVVQAHATKASLSRLRFSLVGMAVLMLLAASGAVGYGVYFLRMRHFWQWTPFSRVAQAMFAVLALIVVGIYVIAWRMNAAEARGVAAARAKTDLLQQAANELPYKTARKVIEKYDPANVGKYLELDLTLEKQVADLRGACRELFGVIDVLLQQRSTTVTSEQFRAEVAPVQQVLNKYARYFSSRTRRLLTAGIDERVMDFLGVTPMPATATPAAHTAHATANRTPRTGAPQSSPVPEAQERVYELQGKRVTLKQGWEADGRGGSKLGFGASVYDAAFVLAHFVAEVEPTLCSDRVVLDIGTGLGLTSVAAALAGARCVLATDGDDDLLQRLTLPNLRSAADESLQGFAVVNGGAEAMEPPCIAVQRLLWGAAADIDSVRRGCAQAGVPRPDIILAADIVALPYEKALPSLLDTLHALAGPDTHVYIAYKPRHVCEKKWFHRARQRCSVEELPPESSLHKDFQGSSIRIMHLWKWRHAAAQTQKPAGEVPAASPALPAPEP